MLGANVVINVKELDLGRWAVQHMEASRIGLILKRDRSSTMERNHRGAAHGDANAPARMIRKSSYEENCTRVAHLRNFTGGGLTRPFVKRVRSPKRTIF
jgi:hypothetical protein